MSRTTTALAALGGLAVGTGLVTALTGRSRPAIPELSRLQVPDGLPAARVVPLPDRGELFFRHDEGPDDAAATVALLHGWVVSADLNWFTTFPALAPHARLLAPDHRGHGRGARPSQPFRLTDVADDVAALIRHLDAGPVIAVGYSMGGAVAQLLARRHPDVVAGLVLCATAAQFRYGPLGGAHWRFMALYQVVTRLLPRSWMERALLAQLRGTTPVRLVQSIGPEAAGFTPLLPWAVGEIERGDVEDLAEAGRQLGDFDSRGWVGDLAVPAAVVVTTRDRLVPASTQLELAALLRDVLVVEVDGDHDAPGSVPAAFNAALVAAVTDVAARAAGGRG